MESTTEASGATLEMSKLAEDDLTLLSQRADDEFNSGDYDKCLGTLKQLENLEGSSIKLRHNRAVASFYKTNCKADKELLTALHELVIEETDNAKSTTIVACPSPIVRYNKAVVYFHRHMHRKAIEILTPLLDRLDSVEESISSLVCLLMLRLLLITNQLNRAQAFLAFLQSRLGIKSDLIASDESSSLESVSNLEGNNRRLKLLALLTSVLNRRVVVVPEDGTAEFTALRAHQYYIMKDFQMAAKQLQKIDPNSYQENSPTDELNTCIANNMGVIHLRVRHYAFAAGFFQKAITFDKRIAANIRNVELQHRSAAHSCEILYNLGISMLHLRRSMEAFQCLLVPLKAYHNNPRLWFRMAEACIMHYQMKVTEDERKPLVSTVINGGGRKKCITKPTSRVKYTESNQCTAVPEPNIEFAALSLRNALTLTLYYRNHFYAQHADAEWCADNWNTAKDNHFCNPSKPISKQSLDNMLSAIYAAYSYVSLRLGDYVKALEMAQELLKAEKLSDAHKMLGHMYAGEALIMLDKINEARPHLEPKFVSSLNAFDFETKDWEVKSLDAAQNVVRYNSAVAMAMQNEFEMALKMLNSCTHPIVGAKVHSLKTYIDIRMSKRP